MGFKPKQLHKAFGLSGGKKLPKELMMPKSKKITPMAMFGKKSSY